MVKFEFVKNNLLIFILFSLAMTIICAKMPDRLYCYHMWMYRERSWETGGKIYERLFWIKRWKTKLPDISDFMKWRFNKKHLAESSNDYLSVFLNESCKSEFTHWMIIILTPLFYIWSNLATALLMLLLAFLLNVPYIMIQRYNRPRLLRLLKRNAHPSELKAAKV